MCSRHKQAQYAGRASVTLNTLLYFKGKTEVHEGFIMGIRKNGLQASLLGNILVVYNHKLCIVTYDWFYFHSYLFSFQVFVPKYGFESVVVFPSDANYEVTDDKLIAKNISVRAFQRVKVQLSLNESDLHRVRLDMKLVEPRIPGFSVDFVLSAPES